MLVQKKAESGATEIISHWHPNITINLVFDHTAWVPGQVYGQYQDMITILLTLCTGPATSG